MKEETLYKYASNSITDKSELEKVVCWIEASPDNQKEYNRIKNQWSYAGFKNFESLLKETSVHQVSLNAKRKVIRLEILKYAAVFILAFVIGGYSLSLLNNTEIAVNEIIVPLGETTEVILSDQTHIWLNSGARLSYPSQFNGKIREVNLSGEAYFEVKRNEKKPFHVLTSNLVVNVLGTSFNVEAYNNSRYVNVTLVDGKVNIENKEGDLLSVLSPDENAKFDRSKEKIEISPVNTTFYKSWKEGAINFKDERLVDIAAKLERWFNVEIVFDQETVKEYRFTGSVLKNKPVDQILEILKFTSNIEYSIDINNQTPNIIHLKTLPMNK